MKIIAIVQIYNELSNGLLEHFCSYNTSLFDHVIVFDDGSTDGSAKYCKDRGFTVLRQSKNDFSAEIFHKKSLIECANNYDPDFIMMLDADEIVSLDRSKLEDICLELADSHADGFEANYINLWRSNHYKRTDSLFDDLKPVKLWKHRKDIDPYPMLKKGLHQPLHPQYVSSTIYREDLVFIHIGFSSKERVIDKFIRYRSLGQTGFELMRFIDESKLRLELVPHEYLPQDWSGDYSKPKPLKITDYLSLVDEAKLRVFRPKVTIFSLIYKDVGWLQFVYEQFLKYTPLDGIEFYFVANDAEADVVSYLRDNYIPFYDFRNSDKHKQEYYINNVYRAYNFGVTQAKGDYILLLNSDMAFSDGWLDVLLQHCESDVCVASRLVEQGRLKTGKYGIEKNFGTSWENYNEDGFQEYAKSISDNKFKEGGLFMPLLVKKSDFIEVGGYPQGNVVPGSDPFFPVIADPETPAISGDVIFIEKLSKIGISHITAFDSIVYHFQEGEKRTEYSSYSKQNSASLAICNDQIVGINGEKTLWGHLSMLPSTVLLNHELVSGKTPATYQRYLESSVYDISLVFQNATFMPRLFPDKHCIVYLQDNLRAMGRASAEQEINLINADLIVANTLDTASSYPEYDIDICPVGVDSELFKPLDRSEVRQKYSIGLNETIGIFIGALDDVKGWPEVRAIIESDLELRWIVISKYEDTYSHPNIRFFCKQPQSVIIELLNTADFFILGSSVETQCIAAIEAALCDVPVVMKPVGIFANLNDEDKSAIGSIQTDLSAGLKYVLANRKGFSPRNTMLLNGISLDATNPLWCRIFTREMMKSLSKKYRCDTSQKSTFNLRSKVLYKLEVLYRFYVLQPILKRDTFYSIAELSAYIQNSLPPPFHKTLRAVWRFLRRPLDL